jgi:chemotaxis-related protein WspB
MLYIVFRIGEDRYALATGCVVEIVPLVDVKHVPQAEFGIAGIFNYHGTPTPVVDLSALAAGRPGLRRLSTRIILVRYEDERAGTRVLGLIAEGATETMRREESDFATFGLGNRSAPYLGPVTRGATGLIQRVDVNGLLSAPIRASLCESNTA